jgi:hypothetical protein
LWSAANRERNRIQKLLEPANVKIGNVVSDVFGISGQRILHALLTLETRWLAFLSDHVSHTLATAPLTLVRGIEQDAGVGD